MSFDPDDSASVLVIGGSGVIGNSICQAFARQRWTVGIHYYQNKQLAEQTANTILQMDRRASCFQANFLNNHEIEQMIQAFTLQYGRLDALIFAAGTNTNHLLVQTSTESWMNIIGTNLTGCFYLLKAVNQWFENQQSGSVILVGSLSGIHGSSGQSAYAASKAGLIGLMKSVAKEWAPWNIRVNAVFPGWHASPLSGSSFPGNNDLDDHLLKQPPATDDVAKAIYHLALMEGVSGQVWNLDSRIW